MKETVFSFKLALVMVLQDTTTGRQISEADIRFYRDGSLFIPVDKGNAGLIMIGEREDFSLKVSAKGYETYEGMIRYEELDKTYPTIIIDLIPKEDSWTEFLTLEGKLPGIEAIEAVVKGSTYPSISEVDVRKRIITLYNPHKLRLEGLHYGIVDMKEQSSFDHVRIIKETSEDHYKLDHVNEMGEGDSFYIARVIFGTTDSDGHYLLRLRESGSNEAIVQYRVNGEIRHCSIDFKNLAGKELV